MEQRRVIKKLANILEESNISYHFDASTSVFIHGIDFEMDDIDIVFMYSEREKVKEVFKDYKMSLSERVCEIGLEYFFIEVEGQQVHCLFYESSQAINQDEFNKDAEVLLIEGQKMMVQSLEFYLKYSKDKQKLKPRIREYLAQG